MVSNIFRMSGVEQSSGKRFISNQFRDPHINDWGTSTKTALEGVDCKVISVRGSRYSYQNLRSFYIEIKGSPANQRGSN